MEKIRRSFIIVSGISFSILFTFYSLSGFSQKITTRAPVGVGMTKDYNFYVFIEAKEFRTSIAVASVNNTIHICPYIADTPDKTLFRAVTFYEFGHYYNYVSHDEIIKTDTLKQEVQTNYNIDSVYWKTPSDLNKFVYKGFDGSSVEKAIIIKKAITMKEGVAAEYAYLEKELGQRGVAWKPLGQYLLPDFNKHFDIIKVKIINTSEIKYFYFDITKFFGRY